MQVITVQIFIGLFYRWGGGIKNGGANKRTYTILKYRRIDYRFIGERENTNNCG